MWFQVTKEEGRDFFLWVKRLAALDGFFLIDEELNTSPQSFFSFKSILGKKLKR